MEQKGIIEKIQSGIPLPLISLCHDVKSNVNVIGDYLDKYEQSGEDIDLQLCINYIRESVQQQALFAFDINNRKTIFHPNTSGIMRGILAMATGTGKSKCGVDRAKEMCKVNKDAKVLIVVPTQKLRDEGWKAEFKKWKATRLYNKNVQTTCYASLQKYKGHIIDLVIMDEIHNITETDIPFFTENTVIECIGLTATPPTDYRKAQILKDLRFDIDYTLTLDEAVKLRLVAPFKIKLIEVGLNATDKNILSGSKTNPFYQTELAKYNYLNSVAEKDIAENSPSAKYSVLGRMRFLYNVSSKTKAAKAIISMIPKTERTLIFCGGIPQTIELCPYRFFSRPSVKPTDTEERKQQVEEILKHYKKDEDFIKFNKSKINSLACVNSLDEGQNIEKLDVGLIVQANNNDRKMIQRMGRFLRTRFGHEALIIIIYVKGTVDEKWVMNSLEGVDKEKIEVIKFEDIENGKVKLW